MKIKKLFLVCGLSLMLMPAMIACNNDDDETPPIPGDDVRMRNDVDILMETFYFFDENNNPTKVAVGEVLYAENPEDYYVGVDNITEARNIFLTLIDDNMERIEIGGNITINLKDTLDRSQGSVLFTTHAAEEAAKDGILAQVTFIDGLKMKGINRIVYLDKTQWPRDYDVKSPYKEGSWVRVTDSKHGNPTGLCIREFGGSGQFGYIIIPSTKRTNWWNFSSNCRAGIMKQFAQYMKDSNKITQIDSWLATKSMGKLDQYYWSSTISRYGIWENCYNINLKTGKERRITQWEIAADAWHAYDFLGYTFDIDNFYQ